MVYIANLIYVKHRSLLMPVLRPLNAKITLEFSLFLLQICVLLFTCLYMLSYLILNQFRKTAEFVTGEFSATHEYCSVRTFSIKSF